MEAKTADERAPTRRLRTTAEMSKSMEESKPGEQRKTFTAKPQFFAVRDERDIIFAYLSGDGSIKLTKVARDYFGEEATEVCLAAAH